MIYELRIYVPEPGRGKDLLDRFAQGTLTLFEKLNYRVVDFWLRTDDSEEIWYLMEWASTETMKRAWEAFRQNPEWLQLKLNSESSGALTKSITSIVLERPKFFRAI